MIDVKSEKTETRPFSFLPRIGLVIEVGGKKLSYRQASLSEAVGKLFKKGFTLNNLVETANEQFKDIQLSAFEPTELPIQSEEKAEEASQTDGPDL